MIVVEYAPEDHEILDFVNGQIRQYSEAGVEAKYILVGAAAYDRLCTAISIANVRGKGAFDSYNFVPIILDPFRSDTVCVLPSPAECAKGVDAVRG